MKRKDSCHTRTYPHDTTNKNPIQPHRQAHFHWKTRNRVYHYGGQHSRHGKTAAFTIQIRSLKGSRESLHTECVFVGMGDESLAVLSWLIWSFHSICSTLTFPTGFSCFLLFTTAHIVPESHKHIQAHTHIHLCFSTIVLTYEVSLLWIIPG